MHAGAVTPTCRAGSRQRPGWPAILLTARPSANGRLRPDGVSVKRPGDPANDTPAPPWVRVHRGRFGPSGEGQTHYAWSLTRTELGRTRAMPTENVETLIVGGGQAGLAVSHMLSRSGSPHLILERGRIAERWRTERWDGLRFQFPNWSVQLPDFPFRRADADGFATSPEIVDVPHLLCRLRRRPMRCGVAVTRLRRGDGASGFLAETSAGPVASANVVVATGPYQRPIVPALLQNDTWLFQVHASKYRAPDQLPAGAVLVVGSGASGAQIAEELLRANRRVYLSVGHHRRMPRRYRGRDLDLVARAFSGSIRHPRKGAVPTDRSL